MSEVPEPALVPEWTLGWRMRRSLAHAGITIEEIARKLSVTRSTISRWVNDKGAPPRAIYLREWASLTGVPLTWLTTGEQRHGA